MADGVKLNFSTGTTKYRVDTDPNATEEHYSYVKLADGTADSDTVIETLNGLASGALRVTFASDDLGRVSLAASTAAAGEATIGAATTGIIDLAAAEDDAHQSTKRGIVSLAIRDATPSATSGTDGDYEPIQVAAGHVWRTAEGELADDAASTARPVIVGGAAVETDGTDPQDVNAEGDVAEGRTDRNRRVLASTTHPNLWKASDQQSAAQTATELKAAVAGSSIFVTDVTASAAAAQTIKLQSATTDVSELLYIPANGVVRKRFATPLQIGRGQALNYTSTAGVNHSITASGYITAVPATLEDGLVAWYPLESDLTDSHSGGLDMTATVGTFSYASARVNNGADCNAEQADVAVSGTGFAGTGDFTLSLWYNMDTLPGGTSQYLARRLDKSSGLSSTIDWTLQVLGTGEIRFNMANTGGTFYNVDGSTLSTSTWYHFVCTYDSATQTLELFENNSSQGTATLVGTRRNNGDDFGIANVYSTLGRHAKGLIDEVAYWDRVLNSGEISTLYNSGSGITYTDI